MIQYINFFNFRHKNIDLELRQRRSAVFLTRMCTALWKRFSLTLPRVALRSYMGQHVQDDVIDAAIFLERKHLMS